MRVKEANKFTHCTCFLLRCSQGHFLPADGYELLNKQLPALYFTAAVARLPYKRVFVDTMFVNTVLRKYYTTKIYRNLQPELRYMAHDRILHFVFLSFTFRIMLR